MRLEGIVGAAIFLVGGEHYEIDELDVGDGLGGGGVAALCVETLLHETGAKGGVGNAGAIESGAGGDRVESFVEEALQGAGDGELDGGRVVEEGEGVFGDLARERVTVFEVVEAVVLAVHGNGFALVAGGADVPAAAFAVAGGGFGLGESEGRGCGRLSVGHDCSSCVGVRTFVRTPVEIWFRRLRLRRDAKTTKPPLENLFGRSPRRTTDSPPR